ncbi:hypothetical protein ACFVS2_26840 [Brevibacillus sp. NPDC058079]|uniref:hypothetical protein n=1 Tax=Brevibacillus sp. NPDC058079 TaxID=3346330 RepID=UPI0036E3C23C
MKDAMQFAKEKREHNNNYVNAVREFLKETISDSKFFNLSSLEQKQVAMKMIQKHKVVS